MSWEKEYCCLGVACKVAGYDNMEICGRAYIPGMLEDVPEELRIHSGSNGHNLCTLLSSMNDGCGHRNLYRRDFFFGKQRSFSQIANFIEKYL